MRPQCKCTFPDCMCETKTNIDMADYNVMKKRAERAEAELAVYREIPLDFIADCLGQYAHAQETGSLDRAGQYLPEDVREAINAISEIEP